MPRSTGHSSLRGETIVQTYPGILMYTYGVRYCSEGWDVVYIPAIAGFSRGVYCHSKSRRETIGKLKSLVPNLKKINIADTKERFGLINTYSDMFESSHDIKAKDR